MAGMLNAAGLCYEPTRDGGDAAERVLQGRLGHRQRDPQMSRSRLAEALARHYRDTLCLQQALGKFRT